MKKRYLILSLLVHLILLVLLGLNLMRTKQESIKPETKEQVNKEMPEGMQVELLPQPKEVTEEAISKSIEDKNINLEEERKAKCTKENQYYGIGVIFSSITGEVKDVPESYPAYKAGVRLGDTLISINPAIDRSTGKQWVIVSVERNNMILDFRIETDIICYEATIRYEN